MYFMQIFFVLGFEASIDCSVTRWPGTIPTDTKGQDRECLQQSFFLVLPSELLRSPV